MNLWQTLSISQSGMDVEQLRAEVATRNIAHANQAATPGSAVHQPLRVVTRPLGATAFDLAVRQAAQALPDWAGVRGEVVPAAARPRQVLDPAHPLANAQGYVEYPGISMLDEMLALTMAVRAYEANVTAFNAARSMALKALEIGGRR